MALQSLDIKARSATTTPSPSALIAKCPVILARGNHDADGDLDIFAHLKGKHPVHYFERPGEIHLNTCDTTVFVLPYPWRHLTTGSLAEQMSALEFSRLLNRFYSVATDVLVKTDAMVDRLIGDQVVGLYIPGFTGPEHPRLASQAARSRLELTGHRNQEGPWVPVGVGVHTDLAYVGVVGGEDGNPRDFTLLNPRPNPAKSLRGVLQR